MKKKKLLRTNSSIPFTHGLQTALIEIKHKMSLIEKSPGAGRKKSNIDGRAFKVEQLTRNALDPEA